MMRALVTYASKHGSTAQVAERIAHALVGSGAMVDVLPVREVGDVARYEAVVLGSSVYFGKWAAEAVRFVSRRIFALMSAAIRVADAMPFRFSVTSR